MTDTITESIQNDDLRAEIKDLKSLLEHQCKRLYEQTKITQELQCKLEKCKAFFDIEIDSLSREWNKLYKETKEACV